MLGRVLKVCAVVFPIVVVLLVVWRVMVVIPGEARRQFAASDTISMTNWSEYWPSRDYTIDIHRDGEIVFRGGPEVLLPGEHRLMVSPVKAQALFDRFSTSRFLGMKALYKGWFKPTDKQTLCLRGGGFEHCVVSAWNPMSSNDAPAELGELMTAIHDLTPAERWIRAGPETIEVFGEEGLDPRSIGGQRLVFEVAQYFDVAAMRALIDGGFPVAAVREDPIYHLSTPVEVAAYNGKAEVMRVLVEAGAWKSAGPDVPQATLRAAAKSCQPEVVQAVFNEGVALRPGAMTVDVLRCRDGASWKADPLATAALLLKHGLPVNARAADGKTLLHVASRADVVRLLLRHGADPDARDADGVSPLLMVDQEDAAIALIEAGADVDVTHEGIEPGQSGGSIDIIASNRGWTRVQDLVNARRASGAAPKH
ncbi:ankyrin repeat domain-containing protein [Caulobacter soli]|uniref:ankyrin repeat domain-containing protein n=1 Tax=Caulobacter soli TaxID=2708539 RepID=UPI0013ED7E55|nr:ankyrin repeat domain-containing protein [Caulobacter soli]